MQCFGFSCSCVAISNVLDHVQNTLLGLTKRVIAEHADLDDTSPRAADLDAQIVNTVIECAEDFMLHDAAEVVACCFVKRSQLQKECIHELKKRRTEVHTIPLDGCDIQADKCDQDTCPAVHTSQPIPPPPTPTITPRRQQPSSDASRVDGGDDYEIFLLEKEREHRPDPMYLTTVQPDISHHGRLRVVDWLVEVCYEQRLLSDTLYLAVSCLDRFLSSCCVDGRQLQLVAISCLWLAAKYEELHPPKLQRFVEVGKRYTRDELVQMERLVLRHLDYHLTVPTAKTFLRSYLQQIQAPQQLYNLASYIAELALLDSSCLQFLPSEVAASSCIWAAICLVEELSPEALTEATGYEVPQLQRCVKQLALVHRTMCGKQRRLAVREKYALPIFMGVALTPPAALPLPLLS